MAGYNYTKYTPSKSNPHDKMDSQWLEETHLGQLSDPFIGEVIQEFGEKSIQDRDEDGYLEIKKTVLEQKLAKAKGEGGQSTLKLATFFDDSGKKQKTSIRQGFNQEIQEKPFDFEIASSLFKNSYKGLKNLKDPLARHLSVTFVHSGASIETDLNNGSGFSVTSDGRLRGDCTHFAQLAYSDLKDIPGLTFQFIVMDPKEKTTSPISTGFNSNQPLSSSSIPGDPSEKERETSGLQFSDYDSENVRPSEPTTHVVLLISDQSGNHLLVDNQKVAFFKSDNPEQIIKDHYKNEGYVSFYTNPTYTTDRKEMSQF